ncbi:intermembrane phospholipid transport protein YdbH family protein [Qipengyuania flava]|uniref:intermembrane phospholipid transport protein YdbH family protein n=1 Tax=Qipengyuania flava TaxID=192812 RepID=UPI001C6299E3|nr:YdbH domain-containing protein [Qipengyuania flava]QYJ06327.1 YdbH domain-containing protein [Qipengyuania flava]
MMSENDAVHRARWRKKRWAIPSVLMTLLIAAGIFAWFSREVIVDDIIRDQLEANGVPASYTIERVGGRTQVLGNVVLGDPEMPDFTAERVVVELRYRLGVPEIGAVTLEEPRLYGSYRGGELSFGSLDSLIFGPSEEPSSGLPNLNLAIRDGRARIATDYGPVGIKLVGSGTVSHGWEGMLAAVAPELALNGCTAGRTSLFGAVTTTSGEPRFEGPARLASLECESAGIALQDYAMEVDVTADSRLANPSIEARLEGGESRLATTSASAILGTIRGQMRDDLVTSRFSLAARGVETPQALAAVLTAEGQVRATDGFSRVQLDSTLEGNGLRLGASSVASLRSLSQSGEGTLVAPLVRKLVRALQSETRGSALSADVRLRTDPDGYSLIAPRAELRGGSDARLVSLSRVEIAGQGDGMARLAGNIATGGPNMPRISGRMERSESGGSIFRLAMERYEAEGAAVSVPQIVIAQGASGALGFSGRMLASGPLPGGSATNLLVPIEGRYANDRLSLWRSCMDVRFDRLELANLAFERRGLTLCPASGRAILTSDNAGLRIAAGTPSLDLEGSLGDTPIRIASGPVGFAYPGVMTARTIDVTLGPADTASRFLLSDFEAQLGGDLSGSFSDADIALAAVPMDLEDVHGTWTYRDDRLVIDDARFTLVDREETPRFEPLVARDASLTLYDNLIEASAALRNPASDRLVTNVSLRHNLATSAGSADIDVPGLVFNEGLQPDDLSLLALGVIANADGTVTGSGRIDWASDGTITSSGAFSSDDLDFAAAFGPVEGASGTIEFIDLLNLTTAPNQTIRVAGINPGVEVLDGEVSFELRNGELLAVRGGSWPFMGGQLILRDVDLNLGIEEERRYIFEIVGLDAAIFVEEMELGNLSATGLFDGTVPIVFDANGNGRIDTGVLISRPPGGNISYVGELTYEDLSAIANFAFDSLRSLDYSQMRVIMEGPLTGEIVTRVRFDGVRQGEGADSNFVTRRLAAIPLQFRINIRAQFYQLLTSLKSIYDPAAVRDPRELGLLSDDGTRFLRRSITGEEAEPDITPEDILPDEPVIQEQESE